MRVAGERPDTVPAVLVLATLLYAGLSLLIGAYGLAQAHLLWLSLTRPPRPAPPPLVDADCPFVTVQLPLFNEPEVAAGLLVCVAALDWPADRLQIQVLDDSTDHTPQRVQAALESLPGAPIEHIRRAHRDGFKAGALAHGLLTARGDCIAIFDADFRPEPDFLRRMVPHLVHGVGLVQGRWSWLNRDESLFTRLLALHLDAHFAVEQPARDRGDLVFGFNGTAGVWRRRCIEEAGGWQGDTLTEDLDLAIRARLAGWTLRYAEDVHVPSEVPADIGAIRTQQHRWMKGGAQVARKLLGAVWRSEDRLVSKLAATAHLGGGALFAAVVLVAALVPVLVVVAGAGPPGIRFSLGLASLPMQWTLVVLIGVYGTACVKRGGARGLIRMAGTFPLFLPFSAALSLHNAAAVIDGWRGRPSPFVRTPKRGAAPIVRGAAGPVATVVWAELALGLWLAVGALSLGVPGHVVTCVFLGLQALGFLGLVAASLGRARTASLLGAVVVAVGLLEGGLRGLGAQVWTASPPAFDVQPPGWTQPDPVYGYVGAPGRYALRFADGFGAALTHGDDGWRTTGDGPGTGAPVVEVHGGSFAYGLGLNDAASLPWRLQELLPEWRVRSRALPGYGPMQAWVALDEHLANGTGPAVLVVAYAGFQDERVTLTRNWRRSLSAWDGGMLPPVPATRTLWGVPVVQRGSPTLVAGPLAGRSVLAGRLVRIADRVEDAAASSHGVSRNLLLQLHRRGQQAGVRVVIAGLAQDRWTRDTLRWCAARGAEVVDVGLPWREPAWSLAPHDGHPNAAAAASWAVGIAQVIGPPERVAEAAPEGAEPKIDPSR